MRAARIWEPHHLGALVESLSRRIVDGAAQYLHVIIIAHEDKLAVTTGHEQTEEWIFGHTVALLTPDEMRQDMAVQMVDVDDGHTQTQGHPLGKRGSDKQRAQKSGPAGKRYGREVMPVYPGTLQRSVDHGEYVLLMRARGKLRYHTAIFGMDILRGYHIAQQYAVPSAHRRQVPSEMLRKLQIRMLRQ